LIEIGRRLPPPPSSPHPVSLLANGRFQSTSVSHRKEKCFRVEKFLERLPPLLRPWLFPTFLPNVA
jgi:hypothetical protein